MNLENPASWKQETLGMDDGQVIFTERNFVIPPTEPVLFFIYGLVCSNHHWKEQIPYFEKKGHPILLCDLRGHYNSSPLVSYDTLSIKRIVQDLHQVLSSLAIKKTVLLGHSMGVNLSLELALRYPELVEAMVLICGPVSPIQKIFLHGKTMTYAFPLIKKLFLKSPESFEYLWQRVEKNPVVNHLIMQSGFNPKHVDKQFIEIYLRKIALLGPQLFFRLFEEMMKHDCLAIASQIKTSALVVSGAKDKVIPPYLQNQLSSELSEGELYTMLEGSHVPQVDRPVLINERIEIFIESL